MKVLVSLATWLPLTHVLLVSLNITTFHSLPFTGYTSHINPSFVADSPSVPIGKTPVTYFMSAF